MLTSDSLTKGRLWAKYRKGWHLVPPNFNMKTWFKSKTIQIGILEVVIGVATVLLGELHTGGALTISGILMVILRLITSTAVTIRKRS